MIIPNHKKTKFKLERQHNKYKGILSDFLVSILGNRRHHNRTNNDKIVLLQARFRVTNVDRQQLISSCVCCADSGTTTDQTNVTILVVLICRVSS